MKIPGRILHHLSARVCSPGTLERIVEPAIADLQKEYHGADGSGVWRRVWILITGYGAILKVIAICTLSVPVAATDERRALIATLTWSCVIMAAATGLLLLPPVSLVEGSVSSDYVIQLLPQALALAIPIGAAFGIAFGMSGRRPTPATTKAVMLAAFAASLLSFMILAWALPAGNQAFLESRARAEGIPAPLMKGPSEMTLSELQRANAIAEKSGNARLAGQYAHSFHLRFSLAAATFVLAAFLLGVAGTAALSRGFLALTACLIYWALLYLPEFVPGYEMKVPAVARVWLPDAVLVAIAIIVASSRSSRLRGSVIEAPH